MNFLQRLFSKPKQDNTAPVKKVDVDKFSNAGSMPAAKTNEETKSGFTCSNCHKVYRIGIDAAAVSLESAAKLLGGALLVTGDNSVPEDLFKSFGNLTSDQLTGARNRAVEAWQIILESLETGQNRRWKCYECNHVNSYENLIVQNKSSKSKNERIDSKTAADYYNSACDKSARDDFNGAIQDYSKSLEINPDNSDALYFRGFNKAKLEDYPGSLADYNKVLQINPRYAEAYFGRAIAKITLKDFSGAKADGRKAEELGVPGAYEIIEQCCM